MQADAKVGKRSAYTFEGICSSLLFWAGRFGGIASLMDAEELLRSQHAEIERLTQCLAKTNDSAEHFEREWYLRGDEIERLRAAWDASFQQAMRNGQRAGEYIALIEAHNAGCDQACQVRQAQDRSLCGPMRLTSKARCHDCPRLDRIDLPAPPADTARSGEGEAK